MTTAVGVAPVDAISNLSKWAEFLGFSNVKELLSAKSVDKWAMAIGAAIFLISIAMLLRPRMIKKRKRRIESSAMKTLVQDIRKDYVTLKEEIEEAYISDRLGQTEEERQKAIIKLEAFDIDIVERLNLIIKMTNDYLKRPLESQGQCHS